MKKIVVLFSGKGSNLAYIIDHLHNKDLIVSAALTNNPNAGGIPIAQAANIPVHIIEPKEFGSREEFDGQLVKIIKSYNPNLVVLAGYMRILTEVFTDNIKAINLHPSLLPRHKGLNAIENSYRDSYEDGGVTIHWVDSQLDGGEVVLQTKIDKKNLSFDEYMSTIRKIEKEALVEAILNVL